MKLWPQPIFKVRWSGSQTSAFCPDCCFGAFTHFMAGLLILCLQHQGLGWQRARNLHFFFLYPLHLELWLMPQNKVNESTSETELKPRSIASASSTVGVCENICKQLFIN